MATKLKVNYEFVGDSTTPVTRTNSIKHGDKMLNKVIDDMSAFVTPEMFGAVGDGVVNDTNALKSCFDSGKSISLGSNKVYKVSLSEVTNEYDGLFTIRSNVNIIGNNSKILADRTNVSRSYYCVIRINENTENVIIDGITIEGSGGSISGQGIILRGNQDSVRSIKNVKIINSTFKNLGSGVYAINESANGSDDRQNYNISVINCSGYNCKGSFVTLDVDTGIISNCFADGGTDDAYDAISIHCGKNIEICNNVFKNYSGGSGSTINVRNSENSKCGSHNIKICDNIIEDCAPVAIRISAVAGETVYGVQNVSVSNNIINLNSSQSGGIIVDFSLSTSPSKNVTINGNRVDNCLTAINIIGHLTNKMYYVSVTDNTVNNCVYGLYARRLRHTNICNNNINGNVTGEFLILNDFSWCKFDNNFIDGGANAIANIHNCGYTSVCNNYIKGVVNLDDFDKTLITNNNVEGNLYYKNNLESKEFTLTILEKTINFYSEFPSTTDRSHPVGDMIYNLNPSPDGYIGWVCVVAGKPGVWRGF